MTTKLDHYKKYHGCRRDGEAVLKAANMGEFSENRLRSLNSVVSIRESTSELCAALGVTPKMTKDKILRKMQDYRAMQNQDGLVDIIEQEARVIRMRIRDLPRSVELLRTSNEEQAIQNAARINIMGFINLIIRFCEDPVHDGK